MQYPFFLFLNQKEKRKNWLGSKWEPYFKPNPMLSLHQIHKLQLPNYKKMVNRRKRITIQIVRSITPRIRNNNETQYHDIFNRVYLKIRMEAQRFLNTKHVSTDWLSYTFIPLGHSIFFFFYLHHLDSNIN